jgi:isoleucyl-tRNA synthetase
MLSATRILRASWSSTLRLPKSSFPPRPLPAANAEYLRRCTDDLYAWQKSDRRCNAPTGPRIGSLSHPDALERHKSAKIGPETFTLHDGPPYANGPLHVGHALNKITKDVICRFEVSQGKRVSYIPGWDCHGLPIEIKALQAQKKDAAEVGPVGIRKLARQLATQAIEDQKDGFKEWAVMGDWDNAYKTMESGFEIRQLEVFKSMFENGLIYRQHKPVHWSPSSRTALAEAELEYDEEHKSLAAFVRYPVRVTESQKLKELGDNIGVVIWTTTPWTLPANSAIAVHRDMEYCVVEDASDRGDLSLVAATRLKEYEKVLDRQLSVVLSGIWGSDLAECVHYENPFQKASGLQPIIHADFVTDSSGTGLVHLAAGHGMDDYQICHALGLPAFAPVDDAGAFTKDAFPEHPELLEGLLVADKHKTGSNAVCDYLDKQGLLRGKQAYHHKYPIDWRTKEPVITRATEQWFANVESIKDASMKAMADVKFIPATGRSRLESFIQGRSQWCISRQRAWGVPIPALYRVKGDTLEAVMDSETIEHIISVIKERGIDAWWTDTPDDPAWTPRNSTETYIRGRDTMDVWFDSGTSWTLLPPQQDQPVADVYLEGTDQHRGWFQSSLLTHVATQPYTTSVAKAPYKTLITHGFTLDSHGRKMSKSLGNVISPSQIMSGELLPPIKRKKQRSNGVAGNEHVKTGAPAYDTMGSDALRLWVASSDYTRDVTIGQPVLQSVNQALYKYRITFKWLLGIFSLPSCPPNFASFHDLKTDEVGSHGRRTLADRLAIHRLVQISNEVHAHYATYEFYKGVNTINKYIANDLSAFYFETLKDRIYTGTQQDCHDLQRVLGLVFYELLKMLAPVTPILVEEVWHHVPADLRDATTHPARATWHPLTPFQHPAWAERIDMDQISSATASLSAVIKTLQERLRAAKLVGSSLESSVTLYVADRQAQDMVHTLALCTTGAFASSAEKVQEDLASLFVVSEFTIRVSASHEEDQVLVAADRPVVRDLRAEDPQVLKETSNSYEESIAPVDRASLGLWGGARVLVHPPSGHKCPRCWRFVKAAEEEICGRCDDVVKSEHVRVQ